MDYNIISVISTFGFSIATMVIFVSCVALILVAFHVSQCFLMGCFKTKKNGPALSPEIGVIQNSDEEKLDRRKAIQRWLQLLQHRRLIQHRATISEIITATDDFNLKNISTNQRVTFDSSDEDTERNSIENQFCIRFSPPETPRRKSILEVDWTPPSSPSSSIISSDDEDNNFSRLSYP